MYKANVGLKELMKNDRIYVKLRTALVHWILINAKKNGITLASKASIDRIKRGKKIPIKQVKIILDKFKELEEENIINNIELLTAAKNTNVGILFPGLPITFNSKAGARFIAAIQGDGYFDNCIRCGYSNQDKKAIAQVLNSAQKVFGEVHYKIYFRKDKTYNLNFPKIVGLCLAEVGLKPGYKTENNPSIPEFILEANNSLKKVYLRQFFSDEGNVRLKDRRLQVKQTVKVTQTKQELKDNAEKYAPKVLIGCRQLLQDLGINSYLSFEYYRKTPKGIKSDWALSIYGKENLETFKKKIGFELNYKNELLENALSSYRFPSAPRNQRIAYALNKSKVVQEKNGFISKELLARATGRSLKTATYYLTDLKKKNLIKLIKKPRNKMGHPQSNRYILNTNNKECHRLRVLK